MRRRRRAGERSLEALAARVEEYARLLVGYCIAAQPGWQVLVTGTVHARPLLEELSRELGRRGCWVLSRVTFGPPLGLDVEWLLAAPEDQARQVAPLEQEVLDRMDAAIFVLAPEDQRALGRLGDRQRLATAQTSPYRRRGRAGEIPTVLCDYPTQAFADEAGISLEEIEELMFAACLRDWPAEIERMEPVRARLQAASEVRIVGDDTDLALDVEGCVALTDDGRVNMPGGEVFCCPRSAEGTIRYREFPQLASGQDVADIRLTWRDGRVVEASAASGEEVLLRALDTDEGARGIGELGIGCNPGVTRYMKNLLYDEKLDGTIHVAIGAGLPIAGGEARSAVHWDMVRSMRDAQLLFDGELVQEAGRWLI